MCEFFDVSLVFHSTAVVIGHSGYFSSSFEVGLNAYYFACFLVNYYKYHNFVFRATNINYCVHLSKKKRVKNGYFVRDLNDN